MHLIIALSGLCNAQNLVLNSSFSETKPKADSTLFYEILPGEFSQVKHWYLPDYINYKKEEKEYGSMYGNISFYSSNDVYLLPKDRQPHPGIFPNAEWIFKKNEGFIFIRNGGELHSVPVLQQHLNVTINPGMHCLKFKYKYVFYASSYKRPPSLDVALSPTDLKEYYADSSLNAPLNYIKVSHMDSSTFSDANTPWQQRCYKILLKGDERFISIGSFRYKDTYNWGSFYIDDIELYEMNNSDLCDCEVVRTNLSNQYSRKFPLNKILLANDSLRMFTPINSARSNMISPETEPLLRTIISFMQRNPTLKIQFIEYSHLYRPGKMPSAYSTYKYYLRFYGISEDRITAKVAKCDSRDKDYCSTKADFTRIGFLFYKDK